MGEMKHAHTVFVNKLRGKWQDTNKMGLTHSAWIGLDSSAGIGSSGDGLMRTLQLSGSMKGGNVFNLARNCRLFKKGSAPLT
jgi:hypothetical protein